MYQQAAVVKPEEEGKQEDARCAETVAEASLKLAFLCNDLLQVGDAHPDNMQSRVALLTLTILHATMCLMLQVQCQAIMMSLAGCLHACFAVHRTLLPRASVAA